MNEHPKSQLYELLQNLGCSKNCVVFNPEVTASDGWSSTVAVTFPNGLKISETGKAQHISGAEFAAAQIILDRLHRDHPSFVVDWQEIKAVAQAGDALIKLGVYLAANCNNAKGKSELLQTLESNSHLAKVFDIWQSQRDPDLAMWGSSLSEHRKATLVEALLWERFGKQILVASATNPLRVMIKELCIE